MTKQRKMTLAMYKKKIDEKIQNFIDLMRLKYGLDGINDNGYKTYRNCDFLIGCNYARGFYHAHFYTKSGVCHYLDSNVSWQSMYSAGNTYIKKEEVLPSLDKALVDVERMLALYVIQDIVE